MTTNSKFLINVDGAEFSFSFADAAVAFAQAHIAEKGEVVVQIFEKADDQDAVLYNVVSGRRILADVDMLESDMNKDWVKSDVDVTGPVLGLSHEDLLELDEDTTPEWANELAHLNHPRHAVQRESVYDSLMAYLGLDEMDDLSEEVWTRVQEAAQSEGFVEEVVHLTIKVKVKRSTRVSMEEFVNDMNYDITSGTDNIVVIDTEVVGSE